MAYTLKMALWSQPSCTQIGAKCNFEGCFQSSDITKGSYGIFVHFWSGCNNHKRNIYIVYNVLWTLPLHKQYYTFFTISRIFIVPM